MFAEHLSARLLVLQRVFLVGRVWPQLPSHLGMQLKVWLLHKHPSHNLVTKSCVHLHKFIGPSAIAALVVNVAMSKRKNNCDESKERAGRLTRKHSKDKDPKCSVKSVARLTNMNEQRLRSKEQSSRSVRCWKPRSLPGTLSMYTLLSSSHLVAHGWSSQKPTNSNVHVSPVGSKVIEMCTTHKICTSSIGTIWLVIFGYFRVFRKSRAIHKN